MASNRLLPPPLPQALARLRELCMRPLPATHGIKPTQLYSRNKEVDETNERELGRLAGNTLVFNATDEVRAVPPLSPRRTPPSLSRLSSPMFTRMLPSFSANARLHALTPLTPPPYPPPPSPAAGAG